MGCSSSVNSMAVKAKAQAEKAPSSLFAEVRGLMKLQTGYTKQQFVDSLVPVEGISCRMPHNNPSREEALRQQVKGINQRLIRELLYVDRVESETKNQSQRASKSKTTYPPEAICRVRLQSARVLGDASGGAFDFSDADSRMEVAVEGKLLFPAKTRFDALERKGQKEPLSRRDIHFLNVEVLTWLERSGNAESAEGFFGADGRDRGGAQDDMGGVDTEQDASPSQGRAHRGDLGTPQLEVRCHELKVANNSEAAGDAMLGSWLPVEDVLRDIEDMLSCRLLLMTSISTE
mmetsp:Transcript_6633/g.16906  ORF Transcript_6633/g.16906 Transcript_6633/m.16906 type:complete len:290 (+) Transcript_6633:76-945(+)